MGTRLGQLVERLGGQLVGDPNLEVTGIAPLADAGVSDISFLSNSKLRAQAGASGAAAMIVSPLDDAFVAETYRGALADTIIEDGVKLDNQIQIGHNCRIGAHTAMAGCVGVAGSATIGKYCTFGGAAMVLGHLTIADKVHISSGSMVSRSILEPGQYTGFYPLAKNAEWEKTAAIVRNLAAMREKIRALEKTIKTLTEPTKPTEKT